MADGGKLAVIFVHGWSVTHTNTYGEFPERLKDEARRAAGLDLDVRNVWLGRYVSFRDEVRVADIARAFEAAIRDQLADLLAEGRRFACVTHSTGGPVIREWWDKVYVAANRRGACPMSHLIMLAPANFGSALAQLGKGRIGRLKSWLDGVEPGTGVLDWLELGSAEAWDLNKRWFDYPDVAAGRGRMFPFVLTGQCIDHALYDHVNSYTGEVGSDGVVRVSAANLNAVYVRLTQASPAPAQRRRHAPLGVAEIKTAQETAFKIVPGMAHSGEDMGIMRSMKRGDRPHPTVDAVLACLLVRDAQGYRDLCARFRTETKKVQQDEIVEERSSLLLPDHRRVRDPHAMVVFRLTDDSGRPVADFDLILTAGKRQSPDRLPVSFIRDKQRNARTPNIITFFLNHGVFTGKAVPPFRAAVARDDDFIGLNVIARPETGFVHYVNASLGAATASLVDVLKPNQTTMVDIELKRIVHKPTFTLTRDTQPKSFKGIAPGDDIVDI